MIVNKHKVASAFFKNLHTQKKKILKHFKNKIILFLNQTKHTLNAYQDWRWIWQNQITNSLTVVLTITQKLQ